MLGKGVQDEDRAWVLQTGVTDGDGRRMYLALGQGKMWWSWDVVGALRFARRQDAEAYRDVHVTGLGAVSNAEAKEHDFS